MGAPASPMQAKREIRMAREALSKRKETST